MFRREKDMVISSGGSGGEWFRTQSENPVVLDVITTRQGRGYNHIFNWQSVLENLNGRFIRKLPDAMNSAVLMKPCISNQQICIDCDLWPSLSIR